MAARAAKAAADSLSPLRKFLLSDAGRNCVHGAAVFSGASIFGLYTYAHNWGMDQYISIVQHYTHGFPSKPSQELIDSVMSVEKDMGFRERIKQATRVFHNYGFEPFLIGSLKTKYGIAIGLPKLFEYKKPIDIDKKDILIEQKPVKWETEEGISFKHSLILSDNAKKFAIAQKLSLADTNYVYIQGGLATFGILGYSQLARIANSKLYGLYKPMSFRILIYSFVGFFCYGCWSTARNLYDKYIERSADERAASLGIDYARGGVEYYAKLLQRNIALRDLMGPNGEKLFTALGNQKQFIREKYIPLTVRKENVEKVVERLCTESNIKSSVDSDYNESS